MMRTPLAGMLMLVANVFAPHPLAAQSLRGRVQNATDSSAIVGAIVQLRDSRDSLVARTVTGSGGVFSAIGVAPGAYRLRIVRIGYQPYDAADVSLQQNAPSLATIYWSAHPLVLAPQRVSSDRTCRINADSGTLVLRVWEEARKALQLAELAESRGTLRVFRVNLSRTLDSTGRTVRRQRIVNEQAQSFHAYSSLPPDTLAAVGYVRDEPTGVAFFAPDATALLADTFAGAHCFALRDGVGVHTRQIGLSFEPATQRSGHVEIRGVFWMDRASWNLTALSFEFDGLPSPASNVASGGVVEYTALPDGSWIVSAWRMRLPRLEARARISDGGMRRVTLAPTSRVVAAFEEVGGNVINVQRGDTVLYAASLPSLEIRVVPTDQSETYGTPVVTLDGTNLRADPDSGGRARFAALPEGHYAVTARFPMLLPLGDVVVSKEVTVRVGKTVDSVRAPNADELLRAACGANAVRNKEAVVFGVLRDSIGAPAAGAITITWPAQVQLHNSGKRDDQLSWVDQTRGAQAGSDGLFRICGLPRQGLTVQAVGNLGQDKQFTRMFETERLRSLHMTLSRDASKTLEQLRRKDTLTVTMHERHDRSPWRNLFR